MAHMVANYLCSREPLRVEKGEKRGNNIKNHSHYLVVLVYVIGSQGA
ncbi:Uncharacterised protein [Leminorella richardii]|uniref:Uncharacterized protein n=1 Tax=Leminorella richardii TaxID=158841 RepID=A0A2X4U8Q9_9GAMM|nr:Uncharacterised protein [Leminorella richardii]